MINTTRNRSRRRETEDFLSHRGSDCGLANVNIGTSGGEKETGGPIGIHPDDSLLHPGEPLFQL